MPGYPNQISRDAFGPTLENEFPIANPKREVGQEALNLDFWQSAGMNKTAPYVVIYATVAGAVVTVQKQGLAFDPNDAVPDITIAYDGVGDYSFAFDATYPDLNGTATVLTLFGGTVFPQIAGSGTIGNVLLTSGIAGGIEIRTASTDALVDADFILVLYGG